MSVLSEDIAKYRAMLAELAAINGAAVALPDDACAVCGHTRAHHRDGSDDCSQRFECGCTRWREGGGGELSDGTCTLYIAMRRVPYRFTRGIPEPQLNAIIARHFPEQDAERRR